MKNNDLASIRVNFYMAHLSDWISQFYPLLNMLWVALKGEALYMCYSPS